MKVKEFIKSICPPVYSIAVKIYKQLKYLFFIFFRLYKYYFPINDNVVLLYEFNSHHGEIIPGIIKYLLDIGFNVDIILGKYKKKDRNDPSIFTYFMNNPKIRYIYLTPDIMNFLLRSPFVIKYKNVIIATYSEITEKYFLYGVDLFKLKPLCICHDPDITCKYFFTNKIISLVHMQCVNRIPPFCVHTHFFGDFIASPKNKTVSFTAINHYYVNLRNIYLLFRACDKLYEKGINNFNVKIFGRGISIPYKYKNFITYGYTEYQPMWENISKSDFILALIDQANTTYTNKASGTFNLSYGLLKPSVIHRKFAKIACFTDENSVLYNDNDELSDAMERCINMTNDEYNYMTESLKKTERELYQSSLVSIKTALNIELESCQLTYNHN